MAAVTGMSDLIHGYCNICTEPITTTHVSVGDKLFHSHCFLCQQCLRPFPGGVFFEKENRLYCDEDFLILHGSRCGRCGDLIRGKCITALGSTWHEEHFSCEGCGRTLAGTSFMDKEGLPYCKPCYAAVKIKEAEMLLEICHRCKKPIQEISQVVVIKGRRYHCSHFQCQNCKKILTGGEWKEYQGKLYCLEDYDRMLNGLGFCYACHLPIYGRCISALGKTFHPEHFVCVICEKAFSNDFFWEHENKALCEYHFNEVKGTLCNVCYEPASGQTKKILGTIFCEHHARCSGCHTIINDKTKLGHFDSKIVCEDCWTTLPSSTKRQVSKDLSTQK